MVSRNTVGTVKFTMFNREYEFSQNCIVALQHFPHGDGITCEGPLEGEWKIEAFHFWELLTGEATSDWEGLKFASIHNLAIRYLHCILANTIFGQVNNGRVNSKKLFFLYSALTQTRVNATAFMLAHMKCFCTRGTGPICIGGLMTFIAHALGLNNELSTLQPIDIHFLDMDACCNMRLVRARQDDRYYLMTRNYAVISIILPCSAYTYVKHKNNWIYDLTAPEPGHPAPTDIPVKIMRVV